MATRNTFSTLGSFRNVDSHGLDQEKNPADQTAGGIVNALRGTRYEARDARTLTVNLVEIRLPPQPASRSSCSIAFSRFLRARSKALASLAREIMELHTLGVGGGYTQDDVTSLARITYRNPQLCDRFTRLISF